MSLSRLEIFSFRNLTHVKIQPSAFINVFFGENGGGKTSLLEAIYHLSFGRSFRTRFSNRVIQHNNDKFSVFGEIASVPVGVERKYNGDIRVRLAQEDVRSVSELAKIFPVQLINPDSYQLVTAGPKIRRQFIDWGVFHVELNLFLPLWKKMQRILKQRNAALRLNSKSQAQIKLWDVELVDVAYSIDKLRRDYINQFQPIFKEVLLKLLDIGDIVLRFHSGWDEKKAFQAVLNESLSRDLLLGYTQHGPHRADLKIYIKDMPAQDVLSRGQQKLLVCALRLSQAILLRQLCQKNTVFLIDDLPSELDAQRREALCCLLSELGAQLFVTGIDNQFFEGMFNKDKTKMFHVKRGEIEAG